MAGDTTEIATWNLTRTDPSPVAGTSIDDALALAAQGKLSLDHQPTDKKMLVGPVPILIVPRRGHIRDYRFLPVRRQWRALDPKLTYDHFRNWSADHFCVI